MACALAHCGPFCLVAQPLFPFRGGNVSTIALRGDGLRLWICLARLFRCSWPPHRRNPSDLVTRRNGPASKSAFQALARHLHLVSVNGNCAAVWRAFLVPLHCRVPKFSN